MNRVDNAMKKVYFSAYLFLFFPLIVMSNEFKTGAKIFSIHCVLCHGSKGMGEGFLPMKLAGYPPTNLLITNKAKTRPEIIKVISQGLENEDINEYMPPWEKELPEADIHNLADFIIYLRTDTDKALKLLKVMVGKLKKTNTDGKKIFNSRCVLCHGKNGEGDGRLGKIIKNPPPIDLTASRVPADYLKMIIAKGGEGVGRSAQMPPWGDLMADNEITAVTEYILTIRD